MMLGFLLARAGISVLVLEKHADFLRDFRGDTIHPSTLEIMCELGLLDEFLQRPHQEVRTLGAQIGDEFVEVADFTHLPTHCRFIAFMPQWDFLDFLAEHADRFPAFHLKMEAEARDLTVDSGVVTGLLATTPGGEIRVNADLVVAADGRHSTLRERAGLDVLDLGAPMDVLWMRLSRRPDDPGQTLGRVDTGRIFVMLNREDYWQCAFVIAKGGFDEIRARGLPALRQEIAGLAPYLRDRVDELKDWSDVKLLSVSVDRLRMWHRPGLLCIGDAAHAMSADRWRRDQPRDPGRSCCGKYSHPEATPGFGFAAGSRSRAAPPRVSDARDAAAPGCPAEPGDRPRAGEHRKDVAAIPGAPLGVGAVFAAAPRPPHRPRVSPRARK
jgi:2-polyprenyl-6-methoxyphenol hydroxylase-like FAD-dependent oxidoreductase